MFGYSEVFCDYKITCRKETDFICFTDDPDLTSDFWDVRFVGKSLLDPARFAKLYKALPNIYLSGYSRSVYLDNTVRLTCDADDLFEILPAGSDDCPIFMFNHPWRDCVYAEAEAVIKAGYDDPAVIAAQMAAYRSLGYPERNGLNAGTMLIRRHDSPLLNLVMREWHGQVLRYSKRDQLSFNVAAWLHGLKPGRLPGALTENSLMKWPSPPNAIRVPRDFDDVRYLALHPDVARAGVPPRKHYLLHGHHEKRRYK